MTDDKCAIIVDESLPIGRIANAAAVLSMSLGNRHPHLIGEDLEDHQGQMRAGITTMALPILKGGGRLHEMRSALSQEDPDQLTVIDLIDATSSTRTYEEYAAKLKSTPIENLTYYGIAIYGPKQVVNKHTGSLGLLR